MKQKILFTQLIIIAFLTFNRSYTQNLDKIDASENERPLKFVNAPKSENIYALLHSYENKILIKKWDKKKWIYINGLEKAIGTINANFSSIDFTVDSKENLYLFFTYQNDLMGDKKIYLLKYEGTKWVNIINNLNNFFKNDKTSLSHKNGELLSNFVIDNDGNYYLRLKNRVFICKNNIWYETDIQKKMFGDYLINYIEKDSNGKIYIIIEADVKNKLTDSGFKFLYEGLEYGENFELSKKLYSIVYKWNGNKWDLITCINKHSFASEENQIDFVQEGMPVIDNELNIFLSFQLFDEKDKLIIVNWNQKKWGYKLIDTGNYNLRECKIFFCKNQINIFTKKNKQGNYVILNWDGEKFIEKYEFPEHFKEGQIFSFNSLGENVLISKINNQSVVETFLLKI
jgi:hypothetical protein